MRSGGDLGKVFIGHNLPGGYGDSSGSVINGGKIGDIRIAGSRQGGILLLGASTPRNGILSSAGDMGRVRIDRDLVGTFDASIHQL